MEHILSRQKGKRDKLQVIFILFLLAGIALTFWKYPNKVIDKNPLRKVRSIPSPSFSLPSGFYNNEQLIQINTSEPEAKIYYTTDGSEPTLNSHIYQVPIFLSNRSKEENVLSNITTSPRWKPPLSKVPKATILRAVTVINDSIKSEEQQASYFVKISHTLPVVSLIIDREDFFGHESGIYVMGKSYGSKRNYVRKKIKYDLPWWEYPANYKDRGPDSERPAAVEFLNFHGENIKIKTGVRIAGNATRAFSQKSLRLTFNKPLRAAFFNTRNEILYNSIILRNSGNDWDKTLLRDAFMQALLETNTQIDLQESRPVIVYIGGEYWGIHYLCERQDEKYLAEHYKISSDSLTIIENNGLLFYGSIEEVAAYKELIKFIENNDLSVPGNYNKLISEIDLQNFTDYLIAETFFVNTDWPANNVKAWKKSGDSAKWRWMISDLDWGFGYIGDDAYKINMFEKLRNEKSDISKIFSALCSNKIFQTFFAARYNFHLKSTFKEENVNNVLYNKFKELEPEMKEHINRWRYPSSFEKWTENIDEIKEFARKRPEVVSFHLADLFTKK